MITRRELFVLGAVSVLAVALAVSAAGVAAQLPCNFGNFNCTGHYWDGITSQRVPELNTETGGAITFATNQTETRVGNFQWAIGNERCTLTAATQVPINMGIGDPPERGHQVPAGTANVPIDMGWGVRTKAGWQTRIIAGHFSKKWTLYNPAFAKRHLPTTVVWHLTGTISGVNASGTMRWVFAGPTKNDCAPTDGSFTWHANKAG
jgi:hypothetical protein